MSEVAFYNVVAQLPDKKLVVYTNRTTVHTPYVWFSCALASDHHEPLTFFVSSQYYVLL